MQVNDGIESNPVQFFSNPVQRDNAHVFRKWYNLVNARHQSGYFPILLPGKQINFRLGVGNLEVEQGGRCQYDITDSAQSYDQDSLYHRVKYINPKSPTIKQ